LKICVIGEIGGYLLLAFKPHNDLSVLNPKRLQTRQEKVSFRQTASNPLLQRLFHCVSIALSGKQPWEPMPVPLDIQTRKLELLIFDSKPSRNLSVKVSIPKCWKAWNLRHEAERNAHIGYQPIFFHIRFETGNRVGAGLNREPKMGSEIRISAASKKPRIQVIG
jgi:hypothetical protein